MIVNLLITKIIAQMTSKYFNLIKINKSRLTLISHTSVKVICYYESLSSKQVFAAVL